MVLVTEAQMEHCPFSDQTLPCDKAVCGDCEVREKAEALVRERIAENMQDYWKCLNSGAE